MKTKLVKIADDYLRLVQSFPLTAVRDQAHCDSAMRVLEPLILKGEDHLTAGEAAYVDAMADLICAYEDRHNQESIAAPVDTLKFLLDENGLSASDLGRLLGSRTLGTLILNGKRELSKTHIRTLAERFKVSPALFL